jgi:transcriptional regulator with GAF, ATPase, and Fis domain
MGKYLITSRNKPVDFRPKHKYQINNNKQKQEESFREAMKRTFASDVHVSDYNISSESGSYMNANSYIKLMNSTMDPDALTKQVAKAGPEGLRFLMNFLARQCQKYQITLKSLYDISHEIELESAARKLFDVMLEVTNARYGTLYNMQQNNVQVYLTNWQEQRQTKEGDLFATHIIAKGDLINAMSFRTSDYHTDRIEENYLCVDPDCIISAPFFGDGMKVIGFIELIGKKSGNPIFTSEDEFLVQALSNLTTILFNQISVKQTAAKKSNNIKAFLTTANSMPAETDMGDLISVIMDTTRDLVNADRCALFMLDRESNELWSKVAQGTDEIRFPANRGIAGHVVTTGQICNIMDGNFTFYVAYEDSRFNRDFDAKTGYRTKTILCVPMMSPSGEIIGAVQAINKIPDGYIFSNEDISQLTSFATLQKSEEMNELIKQLTEQKMSTFYCKCILQSLNSVIITFDESGRVTSIDNPQLLHLQEQVPTMKLTSFEHWLGRHNSMISNDISNAITTGSTSAVAGYDFKIPGKPSVTVNSKINRGCRIYEGGNK